MSLANNLADILKDIFLRELLAIEKRDLIVNDNLIDESDNTKECEIDFFNERMTFNDNQVDLIKTTVDCCNDISRD